MNKGIFKEIGFTEIETEVYLTLLRHKQITAYNISKKTGLYRQACYDALNRLIEKGYVNAIKDGTQNKYQATNPQIIKEDLEYKKTQFTNILPELQGYFKNSDNPLSVEVYKGKKIIKIALQDIISKLKNKKRELLSTSVDEEYITKKDPLAVKQYITNLKKYKIKEKVIIKENAKGTFPKNTTKYKKIKKKYFTPNPTQIYGDNVQIFLIGQPNHLIIIRNKEIAESYRKQFKLIWDKL